MTLSFKGKTVGRANYTMKDYMMDLLWISLTKSEKVELVGDDWESNSESIPSDVFVYWKDNFHLVVSYYQALTEE